MKSSKRLQTHVEMRPSDIKQSFSVPSHWRVYRLRHLVKLNPSKQEIRHYSSDANVTFLPMESVSETGEISNALEKTISDVYSGYTYFREGDVILAKITPCFENGKAAVAHSLVNKIGFGSTEFHVLRPNDKLDVRFLFYIIKSDPFLKNGEANMVGAAGQKRVPESFLSDFKIAIPNIEEQKIISSFLDQQTAKLDQLVEKKQRLIHLLQEKRQALITQAVTKGLDPNVPMKDSGIEWLGEVPVHWTVSRLKPFIILNPSKQEISKFSLDTEVTFVPMEAVNESGIVDYSRIKIISECMAGYTYFRDGDVLLAKITPCFENGKAALVDGLKNGIGFGSTEFHVLRANSNIDSHYLAYIVQSDPFRKLGEASMIGAAGQKRVPESFILNFKQAYPPIDEQVEIAKFLDREISNIDKIINKLNQQITIIQEYRQALITAAVTGQINVREKLAVSANTIPAGKE